METASYIFTPPYSAATPTVSQKDRLTLGFFKRLVTPDDEEALVDGCRELVLGDENKALKHLKKAMHLADGAYLAGFLSLKQERLQEAVNYLTTAAENHSRLGRYFDKYGISATMSLPITDEVAVHVGPNLRGVLLGLVEAYQGQQQRWEDAIACLERLRRLEPDDVVVKLSLAELLLEASPGDRNVFRKVIRLAEGIENETPVHTSLLFYKAKALHGLGLLDAAFRLNKVDDVASQIRQLVESKESASMQFVRQALHGRMRARSSSVNEMVASKS